MDQTPAPSPPQAPNLFQKYAYLLADHLETSVEAAGTMLRSGVDHFQSLMCQIQSEMAIVKQYVLSGEADAALLAADAVEVSKEVQTATIEVGSVVTSIDPAAAGQVAAVEATIAIVEKTAEEAEALAKTKAQ